MSLCKGAPESAYSHALYTILKNMGHRNVAQRWSVQVALAAVEAQLFGPGSLHCPLDPEPLEEVSKETLQHWLVRRRQQVSSAGLGLRAKEGAYGVARAQRNFLGQLGATG